MFARMWQTIVGISKQTIFIINRNNKPFCPMVCNKIPYCLFACGYNCGYIGLDFEGMQVVTKQYHFDVTEDEVDAITSL